MLGLTNDNRIMVIDAEASRARSPMAIQGLNGTLLGIDQRPADGKLYGVTDRGQIVTIDPQTGRAQEVSRLSMPFSSGGRAVVDFNPAADRLRLMGMNGTNFRVHPDTGAVTQDGSLKYAAGPLGETTPRITAGAYTNSVGKPASTELYTIDASLGQLNLQAPPNDGVQQVRHMLGSLPPGIAFDIVPHADGRNQGILLKLGTLHSVDLQTGGLSEAKPIAQLHDTEIIDIAAMR
ncbi:DUF4394 domain-containing protein [Pseudoroseomonas globiformis]|uniref:DUF4394 domain-containing protein n=1 Tax=Teichococcus globiformis TaxID=2307229 RepID=A0ABV7G779_9PROT